MNLKRVTHLGNFQVGRIAGNGAIFITVAGVAYELAVPDSVIALSRFPLAEYRHGRAF